MNKNMKSDIIKTYYELISKYGIENTSISKVAKRIGINNSLIYHYFTNKEELVSCFFDYTLDKSKETFIIQEYKKNEDLEDLYEVFDEFLNNITVNLKYNHIDTKAYYTCYILALKNEEYKEKFLIHRKKLLELWIKNIVYFAEAGIIKPNNINLTANYMMVITDGIANMKDFMTKDDDEIEFAYYCKEKLKSYLNFQKKLN